jgi:excisionase family DNA binding protein
MQLLTISEVAELTRSKQRTVRFWIATRALGSVKIGRAVRVPRTALDQFVVVRQAVDYKMRQAGDGDEQ